MKFRATLLAVLIGFLIIVPTVIAQNSVVEPVAPADPGTPGGGTVTPSPVPEPSTLVLLGIGLAAGLGYKPLKNKKS